MKKIFPLQIFVLAVIVAIWCSFDSFGQNKKMKNTQPTLMGESKVAPIQQPSSDIQIIYYDQTAGTTTSGYTTQDFETVNDAFDNQLADNFTATGTWTINQIVVGGVYFNGTGPAAGFNIYFYSDAGGIPGANVYTALAQPYTYDGTTYFTISISPAAVLTAGNYWVSVQCRMDFTPNGQFGWRSVTGTYGSVAQWQNPGGGFGTTCSTWDSITACLGSLETDLSFALYNVVGPGPATNPNPPDGAGGVSYPSATLSWTNPASVTSNAVYFGTSPGSLSSIYSGAPISSIPVSGLTSSTQYYWRVDETDGGGTSIGPVWTFMTACPPISAPWTEDFESGLFPPNCWTLAGPTTTLWNSSSLLAAGISGYGIGSYSAWADFWGVVSGSRDLVSVGYTSGSLSNPAVKFDWAYDNYFNTDDELQISYSTDGGATWVLLATGSGAFPTFGTFNLVTIDNGITSEYGASANPVLAADWNTMYLALPAGTNMIKFTAVTMYGNNLFVDNISITENCPVTAATNPSPADGATGIALTGVNLGWTNGANTTNVEVWFGPSGNVAQVYDGPIVSSYALGTLSYSTSYQWWIVCKNSTCGTQGPLWSFTTMNDPTVVFLEQFNDLTCWTAIGPLGMTNWSVVGTNNAGGSSAPELQLFYSPSFNGLSKLVSCNITTASVGQLHNLELDHYLDFYADPAPFMGIGISYDNGTTYSTIWEFQPVGGNVGPEHILATFTPTASPFQLVLYHNGDSFNIDYWFVDDVKVRIPYTNDVGTTSIDMAANYTAGTVSPIATVKNFGSATNSFNVQMTIGAYSSTKTVTSLAPGVSQQVTFDNWNATLGTYTVNVCTQLGTDADPLNNCLSMDVNVYSGSWSSGSNNPDPVYITGGVGYTTTTPQDVTLNYLFTVGGGDTLTFVAIDKVNRYDVSTNTWVSRAPLPAARDRHCVGLLGDFIYAIGGADATGTYQSTVFKYDIVGNSWTTVASLPSIHGWGKAVGYNNRLYMAGGFDGVASSSSVLVYDPVANTWTPATSMPAARIGGAFSIVGNQLIYVGGSDDFGVQNTVFIGTISGGDPLSISWTTAESVYPGIEKIAQLYNSNDATNTLTKISRTKDKYATDNATYPPGTMYRFEAAPWGSDAIIVACGSPTWTWLPAVPNPVYIYKPATDSWTKQWDVPIPVTAAASGTVHDGDIWKLVISGGINNSGVVAHETQIWTDNLGANTFQLTVNVANGWNMVSIPGLHPTNQNVLTWWPGKDPAASVFRYNGGYQIVTVADPGEGYWMKHSGATVYNTGDEWPAGGIQIVSHDPIPGLTGWNLIGGYDNVATVSGITTTPPGLLIPPIYRYSGGYQVASTIDPGYGYWAKLSGAGSINLPESFAKQSGESTDYFSSDWGKIIFTDAAGISYNLYAVKGEVNLNNYELPPVPPAGMFDIRFSSGRIAEDINSSTQSIDLSGVIYPVTVKVENLVITLQDASGEEINTQLKPGEQVIINNNTINKLIVLSGELIAPTEYTLEQNYPNPFNPATTIKFSIPEATNVTLIIYNTLGQKVAELVNTKLDAGNYSYNWDAGNAATGMYIYELRTDKFNSVKKMILLK